MAELASLLERGLSSLEIAVQSQASATLLRYVQEIETWNPTYGLVNASGQDLVIKHILDSLAPWRLLESLLAECDSSIAPNASWKNPENSTLTDIGTGAGLPGIPLSIIMPSRKFKLVERMGKRTTFLESQKTILSLGNVEVIESEAERAQGPHDIVLFRAFRPFSELKLFKSVWKNIRPGGAFFAYKGKPFNAKLELAGMAVDPVFAAPFSAAEIHDVWVPFLEEERCVVIVRKPLP
ncbi:MAG: 16S rRNA (guanine(527)-N(7))-methyltransferase RsmG [Spirochaetia bacterium]|jgi:16S rRNA (guanine527-N7)-methyltransferase|nr:16S rRNA (guanine(527)-N(7))-methyltransferase RsmG [Spirochaetia bacterium]